MEILVILAVTLIVFGPQRLPELARYVAKAMKMLREASNELQKQLEMHDWDLELENKKKKSYPRSSEGYPSTTASTSSSSPYGSPYSPDSSATPGDVSVTESAPSAGYSSSEGLSGDNPDAPQKQPAEAVISTPSADDPAKTSDAYRYARELAD
ncbi:MAG TPA: twin-arginine translocase TatA/TatE family subunit [bacterium]|nr:twin-arginine translocase TatA/TatE family subunit [Candidatus Omnitrophota bacterium]HOJ59575.1 twin-arginine translocase TatA/TatE family subunit [bacterium]HOL92764.1 twin-arginine translocase TatA/TatE family subunit [bacterium]HPO99022.1 twin-arginine translocase TatA/TatE family subunit [bacterium]HXK93903.1 twin-arginine translocase TatA/TatE family subunit [bacterium]